MSMLRINNLGFQSVSKSQNNKNNKNQTQPLRPHSRDSVSFGNAGAEVARSAVRTAEDAAARIAAIRAGYAASGRVPVKVTGAAAHGQFGNGQKYTTSEAVAAGKTGLQGFIASLTGATKKYRGDSGKAGVTIQGMEPEKQPVSILDMIEAEVAGLNNKKPNHAKIEGEAFLNPFAEQDAIAALERNEKQAPTIAERIQQQEQREALRETRLEAERNKNWKPEQNPASKANQPDFVSFVPPNRDEVLERLRERGRALENQNSGTKKLGEAAE